MTKHQRYANKQTFSVNIANMKDSYIINKLWREKSGKTRTVYIKGWVHKGLYLLPYSIALRTLLQPPSKLTGLCLCGDDFSFSSICGPLLSLWNTISLPATFNNILSPSLLHGECLWLLDREAKEKKVK